MSKQFTECISFVDLQLIRSKRYFEFGDILVSKMSNKKETIGTCLTYLGSDKPLAGSDIEIIKHNQNSKYLMFALSTEFCRRQIKKLAQPSTVFHLYSNQIKQIHIPLPSLEEQEEIVSKLDKFHELCGNLTTGIPKLIEETEKQYQYYRDKIIT